MQPSHLTNRKTGVATSGFDSQEFHRKLAKTENLRGLWKWQLEKYLRYFTKVLKQQQLETQSQFMRDACKERIKLIRREIDRVGS